MNIVKRWTATAVVPAALVALAWSLPAFPSRVANATEESTAAPMKPTDRFSAPFEEVAAAIKPSLVSIISTRKVKVEESLPQLPEEFRHFFGNDFQGHSFQPHMAPHRQLERGLGSGVIVSEDGHILTNAHVVDDAEKVTVKLSDDRILQAKVLGKDTKTDLAVLAVKATGLRPARLGDSAGIEVGQWVVAAGIPFGLSHTITAGVISATGRSHVGITDYEDFIQTDTPINPGNSGGPLLNLRGEVVGINTAIFTQSGGSVGIGFAIPINMAKSVMASLIATGHVVRGWLGVSIQNLTEDLAKSFGYQGTQGALVGDVLADGPAAKGDMKQGDIITGYEGKKVSNADDLRSMVAETKPGTEAKVAVVRDGKEVMLEVKIGEMPAHASAQPAAQPAEELGMTLKTLTPDIAKELGYEKSQGVVVTEVDPDGLAAAAGIQAKDLIVNVQGKPVENVAQFREELARQDLKKGVRLLVRSGPAERFVFLRSAE
jgi:serine protease Do